MDAAILRQQQQIQQEQLQLQQEQLQQQQSVIEKQKYQKRLEAELEAAANNAGTDTQSVIESIAGDGATVVTVDRLEVSVEVVEDGDQSGASEAERDC